MNKSVRVENKRDAKQGEQGTYGLGCYVRSLVLMC